MLNDSQDIERVRQARCLLEKMRTRLLNPTFDSLDLSAGDLNRAVECLRQLDMKLLAREGAARRKLEIEVAALRRTVHAVEALLRNSGRFYAGLARLLAPDQAPANYTAAGTSSAPAQSAAAGSIVLHG